MMKIEPQNKGGGGARVTPGKRLYLTKDRSRLVEQGDPDAAVLYCSEFSKVPADEFAALMPKPKPAAKPKKRAAKKKATSRKR